MDDLVIYCDNLNAHKLANLPNAKAISFFKMVKNWMVHREPDRRKFSEPYYLARCSVCQEYVSAGPLRKICQKIPLIEYVVHQVMET